MLCLYACAYVCNIIITMNWIIVAIVLLMTHKEYMASPTPLKLPGHTQKLTPYIRHWEAANFDRRQLHEAHEKHIEQKRHRRKRALNIGEYGPAHTIRLNFFAHDREFRLVLRQDPLSVFANDVRIETTEGPMDYDISRVYTGSLEDDENSHIHAILTNDNLLDGTIETNTDHFYIEPSQRYSRNLNDTGIHSIIYRLSDVDMRRRDAFMKSKKRTSSSVASVEHCASERLKRSILLDELKRRMASGEEIRLYNFQAEAEAEAETFNVSMNDDYRQHKSERLKEHLKGKANCLHRRFKRWLPEELSSSGDGNKNDPPLPLDLEVPYNDDFSIFANMDNGHGYATTSTSASGTRFNKSNDKLRTTQQASVITWRNAAVSTITSTSTPSSSSTKYNRSRNIIVNNYNPNSNDDSNNSYNYNNNNNNNNNIRKTYTKHKNIIVSTYNNNNNNNSSSRSPSSYDRVDDFNDSSQNGGNGFFNNNWTTIFMGGNDRPIHKTHVEIITKNGATKKPNIIVNNYNPDIVMSPNPHNPNFNSMLMTNLLTNRGGSNNGDTGDNPGSGKSLYDRKITCMLYLQADHTFFQKMGSDEASIEAITRHVQRANSIYKNTDFNNDGKPDNITFMIKRIKVHNMNAVKDPSYRFPGNYGVEKFLELFSEEDYDAFCLAYMFTYRDFEMGTLGLAWTGDLKNAGGVCEKNGHYRGSLKSLNTGIVTLLNYGKHVPPAVSHVTLAHEIGHNFGSPHDPEQCTPGGEDGNYIMFARATSGDKKNNNKFSPCSLKSIEPVLNAKARSPKGCFTEPQTSICGNGVVEPGEQCDCGWEEDCKDSCCFPMSRHSRSDEKPCTLTPKAMCSPSQGPCCTGNCKLKFGDKCRDDNGCRDPSFCDGRMPQCPPSVNKPNKTICNKEFVCYMGECTGSICLAYGLESCQCIPGPKDDKIKSCELCCKLPGEENPCRSSFEWNEPPFDVPDMYAKPGTPCNDYNGYCDVFQKCREVDPSGPLATLRKLLLSEESIATFKKWIQHNWYTVVLAAVGVFILLILSTKLLAKRSNLKLKSVTIIHSATTETVRLPEDNNGVIVHTAVRTKVPFKKKVRGERNANSNNNGNSSSSNNNNNNNNNNGNKSKFAVVSGSKNPLKFHNNHIRGVTKMKSAASIGVTGAMTGSGGSTGNDIKKATRNKKKRTTAQNIVNPLLAQTDKPAQTENGGKTKSKKLKKSSKEIIDYSSTRGGGSSGLGMGANHTNTFGKVQKWLLESPIVAQPLSHIEHSSKVHKVISKSQSTPERLVQKTPTKSKSTGNLNNEKVKLQVVYKPPFKFALRLSKNTKIKTHIIGNPTSNTNKFKRHSRSINMKDSKRCANSLRDDTGHGNGPGGTNSSGGGSGVKSLSEKTKRAALLLRSNNNEDNQILTLNEPNYETLNPKTAPSKMENPFYENLKFLQSSEKRHSDPNVESSSTTNNNSNTQATDDPAAVKRSSSKSKMDIIQGSIATTSHHHFQRSLSSSNPFASDCMRSSRKFSETNANELSRNFGSTQNLIPSGHQTNLTKSKKRSSLNLKTSITKNGKDPPTKRSNSNMHLRRNSASNGAEVSKLQSNHNKVTQSQSQSHSQALKRSISNNAQQSSTHVLAKTSSSNCQAPSSAITQLPLYNAQRATRSSFSNIPRASLTLATNILASAASTVSNGHSSTSAANSNGSNSIGCAAGSNTPANLINNSISNFHLTTPASIAQVMQSAEQRRARNNLNQTMPGVQQHYQQQQQQQRSNSIRQHAHNHHPPPLPTSAISSSISSTTATATATTTTTATSNISHNSNDLTSDLEVLVSDIENLVS